MVTVDDLRRREWYAGRRITVVGAARQGRALTRFLVGLGADVLLTDLKPAAQLGETLRAIAGMPVRLALGGHGTEVYSADLMFLSAGVPSDAPVVQEAERRGIPLSTDSQLLFLLCPAPIIGITGSSGKSTTTALVGEMLGASGFRTYVGGNIGQPLIEHVYEIASGDRVVFELSSFQLERLCLSPHIAAVLNVTPNHLDRHPDFRHYIAAKRAILKYQRAEDVGVLGYDNEVSRGFAGDCAGQAYFFSRRERLMEGAWLDGSRLMVAILGAAEAVCSRHDLLLRGDHNVENVLAAALIARLAGASPDGIARVCRTFAGVEHRLELVARIAGVVWINDSIATAPERVVAALRAFDEPIVLLSGGRDKHLDWREMADLAVRRARHLILFGEAAPLVARAVREAQERGHESQALESMQTVSTVDQAVHLAASLARPGDLVLLSPGGTSFDQFRDFEERGAHFKALVQRLARAESA